jgi:hypothetical protein
MGWLKDMLDEVDVKSFAAAAKQMATGPKAVKKPSSAALANNLGHLDSGDARWWMATGKAWIPALADVVGEPIEDLDKKIQAETRGQRDATRQEHLVDDWFLRPLDLRKEGPFPAIPVELTAQAGRLGARVWWQADTGSGRTLLGRWLCARWGWERREARTWSEALRDLPPRGQVYLELQQPEAEPANGQDAPHDLQLCVAASFPSGKEDERDSDSFGFANSRRRRGRRGWDEREPTPAHPLDWRLITSPELGQWLQPMLAWVEARLKPHTKYDVKEVRACLAELPLEDWIKTPGDMLDLLAVFDEVGVREVFGEKSPKGEALIKAALRRAAQRARRANPTGAPHPIGRYGPRLLMSLEIERLRHGEPPALTNAGWLALMPSQFDSQPDYAAIDLLLREGTPEASEKVRKLLAASPDARLQNLIDARVLVTDTGGALRIRPPWLQRVLTQEAIDKLFEEGPEGVGALLLFDQSGELAMERLLERARAGALDLLSRCCEGVTEESPERLAALNGAFRAIGLAAALGDKVPVPLMQRVWEVQMQHSESRGGTRAPRPRLQVRGDDREGLADYHSVWPLAALGLSLRLADAGVPLPRGPLNPWSEPSDAETVSQVHELLKHTGWSQPSWRSELREARHLVARHLLDRVGEGCFSPANWWSQLGPNLLVRQTQGRTTLPMPDNERVLLGWGLPALERACLEEGASLDEVIKWCWSRWCEPSADWIPPFSWGSAEASQEDLRGLALLWRLAPEDGLSEKILERIRQVPATWPALSPKIWRLWLDWVLKSQSPRITGQIVHALPIELVIEASERLRALDLPYDARELHLRLWRELPAETLASLEREAQRNPAVVDPKIPAIGYLLLHAPEDRAPLIFERARRWCAQPSSAAGLGVSLEVWLNNLIYLRGPHWREAWRLLLVYERALAEEQALASAQQVAPSG